MRTAIQNLSKNSVKSSKTISKIIWENFFHQDFRDLHKDFPNRGGSKSSLHQAVEPRSLYTSNLALAAGTLPPLRHSPGLLVPTCAVKETVCNFIDFSTRKTTFSVELNQYQQPSPLRGHRWEARRGYDPCTRVTSHVRPPPEHRFAIRLGS